MFLGIDAGSTYTKFVIIGNKEQIVEKGKFKTPPDQKQFFISFIDKQNKKYNIEKIGASGYGRNNVPADITIAELTALAIGVNKIDPGIRTVVDIGGQDCKVVSLKNNRLADFIINDKCAAGAGIYIMMALNLLDIEYSNLHKYLSDFGVVKPMTTTCAVYAQSEIVNRIAAGANRSQIITATVDSVLKQTKSLILRFKVKEKLTLTGGLSIIAPIRKRLATHVGYKIERVKHSEYLCAYGICIHLLRK